MHAVPECVLIFMFSLADAVTTIARCDKDNKMIRH